MLQIFIITLFALSGTAPLSAAAQSVPKRKPAIDIVYRPEYNITGPWILSGLISRWHPFDGSKYRKAFEYLKQRGMILNPVIRPEKVTQEQLLTIHAPEYLQSLERPSQVSGIIGVSEVASFPAAAVKRYILNPIEYATGGTIAGAEQAIKTGGIVFNLGGGYHHAKAASGEGFCVYNDVMLAIHQLRKKNPALKVMVVDLDAHQGNGNASVLHTTFKNDENIAIFDMYNNTNIYPNRFEKAEQAKHIRYNVALGAPLGTKNAPIITTQMYMNALTAELPKAVAEFQPDLLIYNAGTDILAGDRLGAMQVAREAVIQRDSFVIDTARTQIPGKEVPVLVVTSGGYTKESAGIIGESCARIISKWTGQPIKQPSWFTQNKNTIAWSALATAGIIGLLKLYGLNIPTPKIMASAIAA